PDSKRLAGTCVQGQTRVWNYCTGEELCCLDGPERSAPMGLAYISQGRFLASISSSGMVEVTDPGTRTIVFAFKANPEGFVVHRGAFSPDGTLLALGTGDRFDQKRVREKLGSVRLWETRTGKLIKVFKADSYAVYGVDFSPNGTYVAGATMDGR